MNPSRATGWLAASALMVALAACADESAVVADDTPTSDPSADETQVSCGGGHPGWPVSAMDGGIDSRHASADVAAALAALVTHAGIDAPRALQDVSVDEAPWFVLAEAEESVTVATGPWGEAGPKTDAQVVTLERAGTQWKATGWGDCPNLAPVIEPGSQWVEVDAAPDLDPSSTELALMINEVECTSGRDPRPFLHEPTIVEDDTSVTISWTSATPVGGGNCIGNAPVPHSVRLDEPLGDRVLLDGSRWPPLPISNRR